MIGHAGRLLRVTYTLVVDIEPAGLDDDEAERRRAMGMVMDEPGAYADDERRTVTCEIVVLK